MTRILTIAALLAGLAASTGAAAHGGDCGKLQGVEKARCERHEKMYEKCGTLKGDAHYTCDRGYLVANPLDCGKLAGDEAGKCTKEVDAFKTCEANQGREFMRCVTKITKVSPTGH